MSMISGHGQVVYVKQVKLSQWADVEDARFKEPKGTLTDRLEWSPNVSGLRMLKSTSREYYGGLDAPWLN